MEQTAVVIDIHEGQALVRAGRGSACGRCPGQSSCSTLGAWAERSAEISVRNTLGADIGDEVIVEVPDGWFLSTCFRLYGLPMLAFLLSGLLFRAAVTPFLAAAVADAVAMAGGFLALVLTWWHVSRRQQASTLLPVRMVASRSGPRPWPPISGPRGSADVSELP